MTKKSPQGKAHATFSASGAKRWLACAASIQLSEKAPPSVDSVWAEEGTQAHACLEAILTSNTPFATETELRNEHGNEMLDHVAVAVDWVTRELADGGTLLVETKVDASSFTRKGEFGTCDIAIVRLFDELVIADYKHGAGVPVDVKDNEQLIYYLLGIAFKYDFNFERYRIVVIQPRCDHSDGVVREFTLTNNDLMIWAGKFELGVRAALRKNPEFNSGDHCRWCPAKSICPEISTKALKEAMVDFDPVVSDKVFTTVTPAQALSPEMISRILIAEPKIVAWLSEVRSLAYTKAKAGTKIPGFKLVPKRGSRQWVNVEKVTKEAKKVFGDLAFDVSLKTPKQLENQAADAKAWVAKRVALVSSGDTLAPESDSRESVPSIADDFEPVVEKTNKRRR